MMTILDLGRMVHRAVTAKPPPALAEFCGAEYQPYYYLLYLLALSTEHKCVELGVEKGRGAFAMSLAGREVWGFDHTRRGELAVVERSFRNFRYVEGPSLPPDERVKPPVGLLHVDTEHSFAMAREEFWAWKDRLAPGSVVCFDDTHAQDSQVGHFVSTLVWPTILDDRLHPSCGYAVMLYDGERP